MEMLVEGLEKFVYICLSFTPASVEILQPKELTLTQKAMSDWLNELLSLLHEIGMNNKSLNSEKQAFLIHINALARNCISLALDKPSTIEEVMEKTGMDKISITPFIDAMIKEKRIIKKDTLYSKP
jgi:hypothetical protein